MTIEINCSLLELEIAIKKAVETGQGADWGTDDEGEDYQYTTFDPDIATDAVMKLLNLKKD